MVIITFQSLKHCLVVAALDETTWSSMSHASEFRQFSMFQLPNRYKLALYGLVTLKQTSQGSRSLFESGILWIPAAAVAEPQPMVLTTWCPTVWTSHFLACSKPFLAKVSRIYKYIPRYVDIILYYIYICSLISLYILQHTQYNHWTPCRAIMGFHHQLNAGSSALDPWVANKGLGRAWLICIGNMAVCLQ